MSPKILLQMSRFLILVLLSQKASGEVLSATPGQNVTLKCGAYSSTIAAIELTKTNPEKYVYFYRDGRQDETAQDPSFMGRVLLQDIHIHNGNLSLVLKNVRTSDTGTYECRVSINRNKRAIIDTGPVKTIILKVTDSGSDTGNPKDGDHTRGYAAFGVCLGLFLCVVIFVGMKYKQHKMKKSDPSAPDEAVGEQLA